MDQMKTMIQTSINEFVRRTSTDPAKAERWVKACSAKPCYILSWLPQLSCRYLAQNGFNLNAAIGAYRKNPYGKQHFYAPIVLQLFHVWQPASIDYSERPAVESAHTSRSGEIIDGGDGGGMVGGILHIPG